jgi:hypothetical protein
MMTHVHFSMAYISHPKVISVKSTWESMQLYSVISKSVVLSELFRQSTYVKQNITGDSWEEMFSSFRRMVSDLYKEWYQYLEHILDLEEKAFFESIRLNTASVGDWRDSLKRLSVFLARKSERGAMIFIDEYEAPNNRAYELDFFDQVRPSYPSRLRSRLRTVIQANEFFGRGVLPAFLKVIMI